MTKKDQDNLANLYVESVNNSNNFIEKALGMIKNEHNSNTRKYLWDGISISLKDISISHHTEDTYMVKYEMVVKSNQELEIDPSNPSTIKSIDGKTGFVVGEFLGDFCEKAFRKLGYSFDGGWGSDITNLNSRKIVDNYNKKSFYVTELTGLDKVSIHPYNPEDDYF
jgi:hypothetical protein